jgi:hypothetical protein
MQPAVSCEEIAMNLIARCRTACLKRVCVKSAFIKASLSAVLMLCAVAGAHASNCDIRLNESVVDYGRFDRLEPGKSGNEVALGKRRLALSITCREANEIALRYNATPAQSNGYVFAGTGSYTVRLTDATLDGHVVTLAKTQALGEVMQVGAASQYLEPGYGVAAVSNGVLARGKHFTATFEIETRFPHSAAQVSTETELSGLGQLVLLP